MKKKGQLVFQFLIGAVLLFIIVVYTLGLLAGAAATARADADANELESKAMQIANKLVRTPGVWVGVAPEDPVELGLAENWPELDTTAIIVGSVADFLLYCNEVSEDEMKDLLDLDRQGYNITIYVIDLATGVRSSYLPSLDQCASTGATGPPEAVTVGEARRIAVSSFTNALLEITVKVWNL